MAIDSAPDDPEALLSAIAGICGRPLEDVRSVLTRHGVGMTRSLAVPKRLCLRSLSFEGEKKGERDTATIKFEWPDLGPGIWAVTSGRNLRGKSTILAIMRWCLTGRRSGIPTEMADWFGTVRLAFTLDDQPFEVELADAMSVKGTLWRGVAENRRAQATFASENGFESAMSDLFMMQLGLLPIVTHVMSRDGEGVDQPHDWPFYAGALSVEPNPANLFGSVAIAALPARMMQMFLGVPWTGANADLVAAKARLESQAERSQSMAKGLALRRKSRIEKLQEEIAAAERELATLPTRDQDRTALEAATQAFVESESHRRIAAGKLTAVEADLAAASDAAATAGRSLQGFIDERAAGVVFRSLEPVCCPRCDEVFQEERRAETRNDRTCVVCRTAEAPQQDPSEMEGQLRAALDRADAELSKQRVRLRRAKDAVGAADRSAAEAGRTCSDLEARLAEPSRRVALEREIIGNNARLAELDAEDGQPPEEGDDGAVIGVARSVVGGVFQPFQKDLLKEMSDLILEYAILFGLEKLEAANLRGNASLMLKKAGKTTAFGKQTAGERARLKIAATLAIITVAERRGVGRHPGLLLIDSPGASEVVSQDYDKLVAGLAALPSEFRHLQVFVAAIESPTIQEHVPEARRKRAIGDAYLW